MQVIIEKAYQGNKDHIRGALDLFVDFMAIFVSLPPPCQHVIQQNIIRSFESLRDCPDSVTRRTSPCAVPWDPLH